MTCPSDYWPSWFFKRLSRSYSDRLLAQYKDSAFESTVEQEIKLVLHEMRWRAAMEPWFLLARLAKKIPGLLMEKINGQYRRTLAKIRGRADAPSGGSAGAASLANPVPQGTYPGPVLPPTYTAGLGAGGFVSVASSSNLVASFEDAGIKAGEVVAYRCWILKDDGLLYSAFRENFVWTPGKPVEGNPANFSEGVHGFKDRLSACQYVGLYENGYPHSTIVSGTVDLWGEVREHERGYRAQYAAVASIDELPNYDAAKLRKLYGLNKKHKKKAAKK